MTLVNCAGCNRHIRRSEATCPFCGVAVTSDLSTSPERAWPTARLGRAALMAFAAATVGTAACSAESTGAAYGAPPWTGGTSNAGGTTATAGATASGGASAVALYGAPAAGFANNGTGGSGTGGFSPAPAYGAPFNGSGGARNTGGTTVSGGGTNGEADAGDAGPQGGTAGTAGRKGAGGGFAPLYGAPMPIYGAPPSKS